DTGGNGGFVEGSSKGQLVFFGTVDTTAPKGTTGTLLLDPYNVIITNPEEGGGSPDGGIFTPTQKDSRLRAETLERALTTTTVLVTTTNPVGSQLGDITVRSAVTWSSKNTLTLQADHNISIDAPITASLGGLTLNARNAIGATAGIDVARFTLAGG